MKNNNHYNPPISQGCPVLDYEVNIEIDGTFYGCCWTTDHKFDSIEELRNWQAEQKKVFIKRRWPEACKVCMVKEKNSNFSLRVDQIRSQYPDYNPLTSQPKILQSQVSLKNLCNFACIICTPTSSSGIYDLSKNFDSLPKNWISENTKWIDSKETMEKFTSQAKLLKKLTLLGGEPSMIKEYIPFLKELPDTVKILVVTNASLYKKEFVNELKRFKTLNWCYSVDGFGKINDAVRLNSNWTNIEKNIKQLQKDFPNSSHTLTPTWSNFTLPHWKKLYKFAKNNDMWYGPEAFFQQVIQHPEHLRPTYLSDKTKSEVIQSMSKLGYHKHIQRYFREPKNMDKHSINKQYQYLKDIAMFKGIDYEKLFPHIYQDTI